MSWSPRLVSIIARRCDLNSSQPLFTALDFIANFANTDAYCDAMAARPCIFWE